MYGQNQWNQDHKEYFFYRYVGICMYIRTYLCIYLSMYECTQYQFTPKYKILCPGKYFKILHTLTRNSSLTSRRRPFVWHLWRSLSSFGLPLVHHAWKCVIGPLHGQKIRNTKMRHWFITWSENKQYKNASLIHFMVRK
jgi:hypothetical protein